MTILQALSGYYQRMADRGEAEPPGFSREGVSFAIVIDADGCPRSIDDLRDQSGKRPVPSKRDVPAAFKRPGTGISPFFLWDTSAYVLGVDSSGDKRTPLKHAAFRDLHLKLLADTDDAGLVALRRFLERWTPDRFADAPFTPDMLDANIIFRLDTDEAGIRAIHERVAALPLIESRSGTGESGPCLISGTTGPVARLHPAIKGVDGAQTAGAALVSFNAAAYESWGHEQGANAPTGQAAAARYGAALNRLLDRSSRNRISLVNHASLDPGRRRPVEARHRQRFSIGDATVVFWADASGLKEHILAAAEAYVAAGLFERIESDVDPTLAEDAVSARILRDQLESLSAGRPAVIGTDAVPPEVRIHILGLAPNAARLSVRLWETVSLGRLATNALLHHDHCRIEPPPRGWGAGPSINRLLVNTVAAQEKWDNIPPLLGGEVARAVLAGTPYPRTLLSNAIMRLRAGDDPANGWHAVVMRAVLVREQRQRVLDTGQSSSGETPVGLKSDHSNIGYQLGRLFAVYELAQRAALGTKLNRTIRDSYFASAMSTPVTVFPSIIANGQNHLGKVRRDKPGWVILIERELEQITSQLEPRLPSTIPKTLKLEDQAEFAIGYYHQRRSKLGKPDEEQLSFNDEIATSNEDAQ